MKQSILTLIALFVSAWVTLSLPATTLSAPPEQWANMYTGPGDGWDKANAIAVDASGNVYVAGKIACSHDDIGIVKYDSNGVQQWVAIFNGEGDDNDRAPQIALDISGNIYVTCISIGLLAPDYVTMKYDSSGNQQWRRTYTGVRGGPDQPRAIRVDSSNNVYVTGSSSRGTDYDYATIKYDTLGNQKWVARYNGPANSNDIANNLEIDSEGNVYVVGQSIGTGSGFDCTTVKYNSMGIEQWVARYNGPANRLDAGRGIRVAGGNVYVSGVSRNTDDGYDCIALKYDAANGNQLWVARYDGPAHGDDFSRGIALDSANNVYITAASAGLGTGLDYATIKYDNDGKQLWDARYNGPGNVNDGPWRIIVDSSGIYVTGESTGSGTDYDYATIKYDSNGNQLWVARYNGPASRGDGAFAMAMDAAHNVYVTGGSAGSDGSIDFATVKYDSNGNQLWVARYNGPGFKEDVANAIAADSSGNVYITGRSAGFNDDYATVKYNSSGVQQWVARYNGPANNKDVANAIALDSSGNVYVTGTSATSGPEDIATIKYNSSGVQQWVVRCKVSGVGIDGGNAIAVDSSGNVYVAGYGSPVFGNPDYVTIKYNSSGVQQWLALYKGPGVRDEANAIAVDSSGNVYVTGKSQKTSGFYDYATIKYNSSGVQQWEDRYYGPGNGDNIANAIVLDSSGNAYVTGKSMNANGFSDYATIKYNSSGGRRWVAIYSGDYTVDEATKLAIAGTSNNVTSNNVYVTGYSYGGLINNYDYATIKYNGSNGNELWTSPSKYNGPDSGQDRANGIAVDTSGNIYVTGKSMGTGSGFDYATIKYNSSGVQQWVGRFNGPGNGDDVATAIALDSSGNIYVTGYCTGSNTGLDYATIKYTP